jgi:two-component system CheB/CheR fusion protein
MASKKRAKSSEATRRLRRPRQAADTSRESAPPAEAARSRRRPGQGGPTIVGIGASAGGVDAFERFLAAMPADSAMAFVLVLHEDSADRGPIVEPLARHTSMPIVEAEHLMAVEADHVYVIPPDQHMIVRDGILDRPPPAEWDTPRTTIDEFFRSLADDRRDRAIGIVLAGTGAHGTLGLRAVKAAGGMTMMQEPATADRAPSPQCAIASDLADYVLPVEQMPDALIRYVRDTSDDDGGRLESPPGAAQALSELLALLRSRTAMDFRPYRKGMLLRRLERRMQLGHFPDIPAYLASLHQDEAELQRLVKNLLIGVTRFFRDREAFDELAGQVIAPLVRRKDPGAVIRVWVPGCATGEEAYSLVILLLEQLAASGKHCPVQVFGTDVAPDALEIARRGTYPKGIAADITPERLARYFTQEGECSYQVGKPVREVLTFAAQNLVSDSPFSRMDLISCRNVLIYLEPDVQKKVVSLLHFALNEGGCLFLGPSESVGWETNLFEPVSKRWRIFRRVGPVRPERVAFPIVARTQQPGQVPPPEEPGRQRPLNFAELTQRLVLEELGPAAVLVNRKHEILYFLGPTSRYLELPTGEPTKDLILMARDGLRGRLRDAIQTAMRENESVVLTDVMVKRNGAYHPVAVAVKPVPAPRLADVLLLITFQDQPDTAASHPVLAHEQVLVRQLESELRATKEDLQTTVAELEASNEELKASNEEISSMNEELQSTNEELETSKEELQWLNEQLTTVNNVLQAKVCELETANNDMANLLNCTDVATVFLDLSFRIKRYTPAATRLFRFVDVDLGRPIGDITAHFDDPELLGDARQVLQQLTPREKEVAIAEGGWWSRRIMPYRTRDNHVEGVVITFVDITERKRAADAIVSRLAAIVEGSADAIFSKDLDGTIRTWNQGAERLYGFTHNGVVGQSARRFVPDDRAEEWEANMDRVRRGENVEQWETERVRKDGRRIAVSVTLSAIRDGTGKVVSISTMARDITERKRAEAALRESEARLAADLAAMTRLQGVSTRLVPAGDWSSLLLEIVDTAIALTAADMGDIQLLDQTSGTLKIVASRGLDRPFLDFFDEVHEGEAACGAALRTGERIVVEDVTTSPHFAGSSSLDVMLSAGARAVQTTPLVSRSGRLVGMLSTHYRTPQRPGDRDLTVFDLLARQAADWIERAQAEAALRESQVRMQAILNAATDAIITMDRTGVIQSVNPAAEWMFGYAAGEMNGQSVKILMPAPYRDQHDADLARYLRTGERHIIGIGREVEGCRKDGTTFPVDLAVGEIDHPPLFIGIIRDITERKILERQVLEAANLEQQSIGQELHDTSAQELTALGLLADSLLPALAEKAPAEARIAAKMAEGAKRVLNQVRSFCRGLIRVEVDSEGLMAALTELATQTSELHGVTCSFECRNPVHLADNQTATQLYSIAREAVTNAIKHARAQTIRITLEEDEHTVTLRVQDDGVGMSEPPPDASRMGLRIMRHRAGLINAHLSFAPASPAGTVVTCIHRKGARHG